MNTRNAPYLAPVTTLETPRRRGHASVAARELMRFGPPAYVADLDGNVMYANPRYEKLAADMRGRPRGKDEPHNPIFDIGEVIARVIAGESEINRRDSAEIGGIVRMFRSSHFPIHDEDGTLGAVGGIYEDATADASNWRDILKIKERYDDIARLSVDWIWESDAHFKLTYVSPRVTEVLDMHPREMIGRDLLTLGTFDRPGGGIVPNAPTFESRSPFRNLPFSVTLSNGTKKQFRLSGLPMFAETNGAFCGFRGTATDVSAETEARQSADVSRGQLSTAIENISEGFALYDINNRLVLCNKCFREYLTGAHRVLFPGAPFQGIVQAIAEQHIVTNPAGGLEQWLALRNRAEQSGEASLELQLASGHWIRITDRPTSDGGIVSIISDITEGKDREETLRSARDIAEEASRAKSEFLANMSHELRTPLNAIIGFSEIMRTETLGPMPSARYLEYLDDIIVSSQHLLGVINDILDVAKAEAGKLELNEDRINVADEIKITVRLFSEQADDQGVKLVSQIPADLPPLWADQRKVRQVLLNLISNAIKFTPAGGRVTVSAEFDGDDGLAIIVEDTGIGISKEDIAAAMAPFGQVESSLSRRYEGTGLGLPLTQALIERHGGTLHLESEVGMGTRVTARFPRKRVIA